MATTTTTKIMAHQQHFLPCHYLKMAHMLIAKTLVTIIVLCGSSFFISNQNPNLNTNSMENSYFGRRVRTKGRVGVTKQATCGSDYYDCTNAQ